MQVASPRGNPEAGTSGVSTFLPAIGILLLLGLALRLIIAYVLLPGSGFPNDLGSFQGWSSSLASHGTIGFYSEAGFLDYPPVYLLFLFVLGLIANPAGGVGEAVKLIPIFADLALAFMVYVVAMDLGASRRRAFIAAAVVLLNPITWFNSAIWGQADAVGSVFLLLGLRALLQDRRELASALAVVAALTKIQLGILGIVVGFVVLRRSILPRDGKADPARVLTSIASGIGTGALVCLPFTGLDFLGLPGRLGTVSFAVTAAAALVTGAGAFIWARRRTIVEGIDRRLVAAGLALVAVVGISAQVFDAIAEHILNTFGEYPYLTLNAYNPWALMGDQGGSSMARNLGWVHDAAWQNDTGATMPGFNVGPFSVTTALLAILVALFLAGMAFLAWQWARVQDEEAAAYESGDEDGAANARSASDEPVPGGKPPLSWPMELRGVTAGCLVAIGAIVFVFGGQVTGPIPAAIVGDGFLVAALAGVGLWAARRDDLLSITVALAILAIAFFVVPTRAHERYLFPFFAVGAVLLAVSWRWTLAYAVLAVVNTANLLAVLVQYDGIPARDGSLGQVLIDWGNYLRMARFPEEYIWPIALSAVATGAVLLWALMQMRPRAVQVLAWEAAGAGAEPGAEEGAAAASSASGAARGMYEPAPQHAGPGTAAARIRTASAGLAPGDYEPAPEYAEYPDEDRERYRDENEPEFVPEPVMRLWRFLYRPSVRPDRSAALATEPRGRLDKMDLWLVVVLVAVLLSTRIYRLGEPRQMHFDEVYHARTATEFLQEWRYGIPHDIYEWTHPHLAKYAIGAGITIFSDYKVTATSRLDVSVKDVVVQPRTAPASPAPAGDASNPLYDPNARLGDRVYIATGSAVDVYDLETRNLVWSYAIPGATTVSLAAETGYLYAGTSDGHIWRIDMTSLDDLRVGRVATPAAAVEMTVDTGFAISKLYAGSPPLILAEAASGDIVSVDGTGKIVGRGNIPGAADFATLGTSPATVSFVPGKVTDPAAEAGLLADATGVDASQIEAMLSVPATGAIPIRMDLGKLDQATVTTIQSQIDNNKLPGIVLDTGTPQLLVAYSGGLALMNSRQVFITSSVYSGGPATSIAINTNSDQDSYVAAGQGMVLIRVDQAGGTVSLDGNQPLQKMPGPVTKVVFDDSNKVVQVLGRTQDGTGWAFYAIETNGNAVFDDARLPFEPVAVGLDASPQLPAFDRQEMLFFGPDGTMGTVDVGQFAFSWRIVGVLFGTLMAVCLFLLARLLFRRRTVGILVGFFSCVDGMFFVQSRIAMNDTYVGGLLLLAYLIFALLWLNGDKGGRWRWAAFWLGMPVLGVTLGLALAAKWVTVYAIAGISVLILARSALGRVVAILALAVGTGTLGWMAIAEMRYGQGGADSSVLLTMLGLAAAVIGLGAYLVRNRARTTPDRWLFGIVTAVAAGAILFLSLGYYPPPDQNGSPNYTFFLILFGATMVAALVTAYHPIAWTRQEMRFAIAAPVVLGVLAGAVGLARHNDTLRLAGFGLVGAGVAVAALIWVAGRAGFGPLAVAPPPDDPAAFAETPAPAPKGWLNLGSGFGLPAVWMGACVLILPLAVYIAMYVPWAMPWQQETAQTGPLPVLMCWQTQSDGQCANPWPAGHTGQTLFDLTISMYNYHNDLRATHAASSPWWAWPFDLKPVWFESDSYALNTGSMIYDGGNPVTWWLAIAGMAFVCWQAFKRRSLGLALIATAFFWQWLSWVRIDRATFQYHFYTALPFYLMGLAYFLAELWHGPSRRTWLFARAAAAVVLLFPPLLWLGKGPLCQLARVATDNYFGQTACLSSEGNFVVEERMFWIAVVLIAALGWLLFTLLRLERTTEEADSEGYGWAVQLLAPVAIAGALLIWLGQNGSRRTLFAVSLSAELVVLMLLALFVVMALVALTARDPRRFVLGICAAAAIAFVILYPNLSALVMPSNITSAYNGFLPTWLYGFQFNVNLQPAASVSPVSTTTMVLSAFVAGMALLAAYAAWISRVVNGYRRHVAIVDGADLDRGGAAAAGGAGGAGSGKTGGAAKTTGSGKTGGPAV